MESTTTSTRKSSIAMYSSSSAARGNRCISSMNRTSSSSNDDRMLARSPACWIAGPDVTRIGTPSSLDTIIASVVLPNPGGPASRMWSGGTCRLRAASRKSCSCFFSSGWPMKESKAAGRSSSSLTGSSSNGSAETMRSDLSRTPVFCSAITLSPDDQKTRAPRAARPGPYPPEHPVHSPGVSSPRRRPFRIHWRTSQSSEARWLWQRPADSSA